MQCVWHGKNRYLPPCTGSRYLGRLGWPDSHCVAAACAVPPSSHQREPHPTPPLLPQPAQACRTCSCWTWALLQLTVALIELGHVDGARGLSEQHSSMIWCDKNTGTAMQPAWAGRCRFSSPFCYVQYASAHTDGPSYGSSKSLVSVSLAGPPHVAQNGTSQNLCICFSVLED